MAKEYGNRITDNALSANDGKELMARALSEIESQYGWKTDVNNRLFSGVYYDSQKVGSFIVRAQKGETRAVVKLQLRPLPFDEGFIIRHVSEHNRSARIRLPGMLIDKAWNEKDGYGFIIFEDLSGLPNLWEGQRPTSREQERHADFLKEFFDLMLPADPWLPMPKGTMQERYREAHAHFSEIAAASANQHVERYIVEDLRSRYFAVLDRCQLGDIHFTHGHLSGFDVKYDETIDGFTLLANLYWSYRPRHYELAFPMWVDIMHTRDEHVTLASIVRRIEEWTNLWSTGVLGRDPSEDQQYWFNLLNFADRKSVV